ncbi:MAG TPA: PAS domain S-box protein [Anaerolineales bacterium]|nr:PAS domain S-box protein [Anaerolineales bacterium]
MHIIPRIALVLLTTLLIFAIGQLSGLLPPNLPGEVVWSLPGIVTILFIGILLTDRKIQSTNSRQQTTLEAQVAQRTQELQVANQKLELEIVQRKRVEEALAKQVEEELSVSNARFQAMFNDAAVGMGILGLDRRIIDANPALCRIYGRPREELIGMSAAEVTDTEDKALAAQLFSELLAGQRDSYEVDRRYIRKNGEVFWAHVTLSAVRGLDGQPVFLIGMVMDIDEQKKMQERIRESQARFQALYDNVAVGIAVMTLERRPIAFNSTTERIIGYELDELQNVDLRLLAVPEDRAMDMELFQELKEGKRNSYVMERRYRHKSGRIFWARINYSLVRDLESKPDYLVGIIEDIDDQKRAAERLAAQEVEYRRTLEQSVEERTHKLAEANQRLQKEIEERLIIEEQLAKKAA